MSRSTAPTITSPLEAWPARPSPRTSPLSSKVSSLSSSPTRDGKDSSTSYTSRETSSTSIATTMTRGESSKWANGSTLPQRTLEPAGSSAAALGGSPAMSSSTLAKSVQTPPPRVRLVKGSLEDDPQSTGEGSTNHHFEAGPSSDRRYAPPRRPLTPGQLGRIAQSFGIVIPSLPHPSPTSVSLSPFQATHRSPLAMTRELRGTPWLVTVIPPFSILLPLLSTSTPIQDEPQAGPSKLPLGSPEAARERERKKKWKRGRLLALQPTMGSMLLSIAREYGLPSTQGINLYLVHQPSTHLSAGPGHAHSTSISSNGSFGSNFEEATGPQISAQTWSTLFASYLVQSASSSRASTPAHTPLKSSGPLGRDIAFPPSPLSLADPPKAGPSQPTKLSPSSASSSSGHSSLEIPETRLPPTPHSLGQFPPQFSQVNPIVGSIEFDVDPDQAGWYDEWRRTARQRPSHSRKISSASDSGLSGLSVAHGRGYAPVSNGPGGIRQLNLLRKVNDGKGTARFLRDLDGNRPTGPWGTDKPRSMSLSASGSRPRVPGPPRQEVEHVLVGRDGSDLSSLLGPAQNRTTAPHETDQHRLTESQGEDPSELLASPIALDRQNLDMDRVREVMQEALRNGEGEKRGSGLVMADELDRLEQIMRNLSPREIRVTSPRALTPRMAAKIAAAKIQADSFSKMPSLSPNPGHSTLLPSPLASGFTAEPPSELPVYPSAPRPAKSSTDSASTTTGAGKKLPTGAWPAVPYASSPESPRIDEYFQPKLPGHVDGTNPRSAETLQRGRNQSPPIDNTERFSEWRPARPRRPASPGLGEQDQQRTISYTLPAGHVDLLRQNTTSQAVPIMHARDRSISSPITQLRRDRDTRISPGPNGIGESPRSPPQPRSKERSGSISFKELRNQLSSRSISVRWGEKTSPQAPEASTSLARAPIHESETIGLFRSPGASHPAAFASLDPSPGGLSGPPVPAKQVSTFELSPPLQMAEWGMTEVPSPPTHTFASNEVVPLPSAPLQSREPNSSSLPASGKALASKILGGMNGFTFGKKPSISSLRQMAPPSANRSVSAGQGDSRPPVAGHARTFSGSKSKSRRNPSVASITISSPITSTFRQVEGTSPQFTSNKFTHLDSGAGLGRNGAMESPPFSAVSAVSGVSGASGTSTELPYRSPPRQHAQPHPHGDTDRVPRKAVPGTELPVSESFASSRSFVLEDPPRRRVR